MSDRENEELHFYFIVRSILMGLLGALVFSVIISFLKIHRLPYVLSISGGSFFIVMFITRAFDDQIKWSVEKVLQKLEKRPRVKNFLLEYF